LASQVFDDDLMKAIPEMHTKTFIYVFIKIVGEKWSFDDDSYLYKGL
jgi:hypothetical protein